MSVNIKSLFPAAQAPLEAVAAQGWLHDLNETIWLFAVVETLHLLFLGILGGAVLLLNLRLLGVVLPEVSAPVVERTARPWLIAGIVGTTVTGVFMGFATIVTVLGNAAFFVKIVALVAATLLSVAVSRQVARGQDGLSAGAKLLAGFAIVLWIGSLVLFVGTSGLQSGSVLVALSGFGLFAAFLVKLRRSYLVLIGGVTAVALIADVAGVASATSVGLAALAAILFVSVALGIAEARRETRAYAALRVAAFVSTLSWVTVGAAGRWIGFS